MLHPTGKTYLEQFGNNEEIKVIRNELLLSELFAERALEIIVNKGTRSVSVGRDNEKFISDSINQIGRKNTPNLIEQYTWWVSCIEREVDLLDEYAINNNLYKRLMIEAKICLQEYTQYNNGNIPGNSVDLIQGGRYEEHYWNIIEQMNKILTINYSIKLHLDSSGLE